MLYILRKKWASPLRALIVLGSLAVLVGCAAPTWSARVTSFQQWPPDAMGKTYHIVSESGQAGNLETQAFSDMIRANIGRTGLVEAQPGQKARFNVSFDYGNPVTQTWVQQYADPYFYNGFSPGFGPWGGYYGGGWGGGVFYSPPVVNVPVQIYKNTLTVIIKDNARNGVEVYRSSAVSASSHDNLLNVMPYLARAVFEGFPGNNGQQREVQYERQR